MNYTVEYLRQKSLEGNHIGTWRGASVYPISKRAYELRCTPNPPKSEICYYLIYDDEYKVVKNNAVIAKMSRDGTMIEYDRPLMYISFNKPKFEIENKPKFETKTEIKNKSKSKTKAEIEIEDNSEIVMEDVLKQVDDLLKEATAWQD